MQCLFCRNATNFKDFDEKKVPKEEFIKRYGKNKGEMVYYGTLTNMAKDNA